MSSWHTGAWGPTEYLRVPANYNPCHDACLQLVETYLGKPGLVRETSRVGAFGSAVDSLRNVFQSVSDICRSKAGMAPAAGEGWSAGRPASGRAEAVRAFQDVVLAPDLKEQVLPRVGAFGVLIF